MRILTVTLGLLCALSNLANQRSSEQPAKQYKAGEMITLKDGTKLQVVSDDKGVFAKCAPSICTIKRTPVVVTLRFSGETISGLLLGLSLDAEKSDITLIISGHKLIPTAIFDPKSRVSYFNRQNMIRGDDGRNYFLMTPVSKLTLSVLFDAPPEVANERMELSLQLKVDQKINALLVKVEK